MGCGRQVLDDRRLAEGIVRLEITASGKGLIPDLDSGLLALDHWPPPGFARKNVVDEGLEVSSLDTKGDQVQPVSQRSWVVELTPSDDNPPTEFTFPQPRDASVAVSYERYDDANVVDSPAIAPLHVPLLSTRGGWWWTTVAAGALLIVGAVATLAYRRRRRRAVVVQPGYQRPSRVTAFSLLVLLKRIHDDTALHLSMPEQQGLGQAIADLEHRYFAGAVAPTGAPELTLVLDRWLARATNGNGRVA